MDYALETEFQALVKKLEPEFGPLDLQAILFLIGVHYQNGRLHRDPQALPFVEFFEIAEAIGGWSLTLFGANPMPLL